MPSSDLPDRPWIYREPPPYDPIRLMHEHEARAAVAETLSRARNDIGPAHPAYEREAEADFVTAPQYDAEKIQREMHEVITRARTMALPLAGARLHMGQDVFDDLSAKVRQQVSIPGALTAFWGVPLVVEADRPGLIELRWTVRA